ncbi:multiheme c-type cytochrome [Breoghania sp.]|nr:multiheme c-type cytochrome [Breoghania sp.]MDJ0932205.1 multiheme c-type cytochrome [Breoghania sp.]
MATKMGIRRLKADSACLGCHFTEKLEGGKPEAIAGISCESCHGSAKN